MIIDGTLRIGGNSVKVWFGKRIEIFGKSLERFSKFLFLWGNKIVVNNKTKIITNPSAKLCNPFTMIISFTLDASDKYQLVLQGDYKDKYKEATKEPSEDGTINMPENDLFMIISQNRYSWFKKD
jgi:hypothetical protein